jgi:hypothetical protein
VDGSRRWWTSPRAGVGLGVGGFWLAAALGGRLEPGYQASEDYLSALASVGASGPVAGLLMFACGAGALAAASAVVREVEPAAVLGGRLLLAAAAFVAVGGLARVRCLDGAAGCNAGPLVVEQVTVSSEVHAVAIFGYQVAFSAAMVGLAVVARSRGRPGLAALGWVGAVVTPVLALDPLPLTPGWSQRLWVVAGHAVLLGLAAWPAVSREAVRARSDVR